MLNHAAVVLALHTRSRALRILTVSLLIALFGAATSASALEGIDLSSPAEPTPDGECSRLVKIKYPFLKCTGGEIGQSASDEIWSNSRRIPIGSDFVEGGGYFGQDLNSN